MRNITAFHVGRNPPSWTHDKAARLPDPRAELEIVGFEAGLADAYPT